MLRKNKQSEDAESYSNSSITSEEPQSKSFVVGGTRKLTAISLPQVQLKKKQSYKKQAYCIVCLRCFTSFFRQHHCRVCANAVCSDCSPSLVNKQRACDLCIMQLSNPQEQKKKKQVLDTLETLCAYLIYRRNIKMTQLQALKSKSSEGSDTETLMKQLENQQKKIQEMQKQNSKLKEDRDILQEELEKIRQANAQIEDTIAQLQRQIGTQGLDQY